MIKEYDESRKKQSNEEINNLALNAGHGLPRANEPNNSDDQGSHVGRELTKSQKNALD
jgi:hypothetical protein